METLEEMLSYMQRTNPSMAEALRTAIGAAMREAYSEGHCDGQNAADDEGSEGCTRNTTQAWEQSLTRRALAWLT